jgi:hypothetical protein
MQLLKQVKKKLSRQKIYFLLFVAFAGLVISACVSTITIVSQQALVVPGDTAHMVLNLKWAEINYDRSCRQVVGICVPRSWNAAQNTTMTYRSDVGNGDMVLVPENIVDPSTKASYIATLTKKYGIGPNYVNDMEWVVFWSDVKLNAANQQTVAGNIFINIKTSGDNLSFKPGYFMCEDEDGISDANSGYYQSIFGSCMLVSDGINDVIDFCNPQIGTADPASALDNDIVTIKYNGSLDNSALKNEENIYFCAKAFTTTGSVIDLCQQTAQTKLTKFDLQQWRIDFWPKKYFNLSGTQSISRIEYYFTNQSGTLKTGYANTTDPFKYSFKCK